MKLAALVLVAATATAHAQPSATTTAVMRAERD